MDQNSHQYDIGKNCRQYKFPTSLKLATRLPDRFAVKNKLRQTLAHGDVPPSDLRMSKVRLLQQI